MMYRAQNIAVKDTYKYIANQMQKISTGLKNLSIAVPVAAAFWIGTDLATPSSAASFIGTISGEVTSVTGSVPGVTKGSVVSGNYAYNDLTPISNKMLTGVIGYQLQSFSLTIGNNPKSFYLPDTFGVLLSAQPTILTGNVVTTPPNYPLDFGLSGSAVQSFFQTPTVDGGSSFDINVTPETYVLQSIQNDTVINQVDFNFTATNSNPSNPEQVPEPSSIAGVSVFGLFWLLRKKVATSRRT